jgi:hypothetical protein
VPTKIYISSYAYISFKIDVPHTNNSCPSRGPTVPPPPPRSLPTKMYADQTKHIHRLQVTELEDKQRLQVFENRVLDLGGMR